MRKDSTLFGADFQTAAMKRADAPIEADLMKTIITVDGPAGSGKSTVSRLLARRLGFLYLDTGAMYRGAALEVNRAGIPPEDGKSIGQLCRDLDLNFRTAGQNSALFIGDEDVSQAIRSPHMDMFSSQISALKEVREAMTDLQRKMGQRGNLVAEGRDMGSVVFPDADHKFFLTASLAVRAKRRYEERTARAESVSRSEVEKELEQRDLQDETSPIAPLRPAPDARRIDTTGLTPEEVVETILAYIQGACEALPQRLPMDSHRV